MERRNWITIESGGQQVFGVVHQPKAVTHAPIVVMMHGFASSKHGTNRSYVTFAEELAKQGIASLRFDFRGAGDSEGTLATVTLEDLVDDAVAALEFSEELEGIDKERIGVFGSSLGATIAVLSAERYQKAKAMTLWSPLASGELWVHDFMTQNPEMATQDPKEVLANYRGFTLHPEFRRQFGRMSAAKTIEKLGDVPLLHMHGESDKTVSILHQQVYKMHCEGREAPARFISYPDVEHQITDGNVFPKVVKETLEWFKTHL